MIFPSEIKRKTKERNRLNSTSPEGTFCQQTRHIFKWVSFCQLANMRLYRFPKTSFIIIIAIHRLH